MSMIVGTCRVVLSIPGSNSLKDKRKVVRSVLDRVRAKFNVAAAEVESLDAHRTAVIGLAVVSNDSQHVNSMIDTITSFISGASEALLEDRKFEIIHCSDPDRGWQV